MLAYQWQVLSWVCPGCVSQLLIKVKQVFEIHLDEVQSLVSVVLKLLSVIGTSHYQSWK